LSAPGGSTVAAAPLRTPAPRPPVAAPAGGADGPLAITPSAQPKLQQRVTNPPPVPTQVASAAPVAALPATAAPAAATGSGFSVQLAAPGSESEARTTFSSLQRRFSAELGGMQPSIRRAEVGERTIYRLRVGPMSREEANSLCSRLQGAGGQCFVARN
jgi:cell division septation protein DedD